MIDFAPFLTTEEKWVVCLDTMGQDRQFSDDQKRFTLQAVQAFKQNWERAEMACLMQDRDKKIEVLARDPALEQETTATTLEQIERTADEKLQEEGKEFEDEEQKEIELGQHRLTTTAIVFKTGAWQEHMVAIQELNVIKTPKVVQALMFLLGVSREEICEPGSNKLFWKKARQLLGERIVQLMCDYRVLGSKQGEYRAYQTINYCERLIQEHSSEDVESYSFAVFRLFKWLQAALALRKQDIIRRKDLTRKARDNREAKLRQQEERTTNREVYLSDAQDKFKEDNREQIELFEKWEEEERIKASQEYGEELDDEDEEA